MAKPPPVEHFRIFCETDNIECLGPVMSALVKIPNLTVTGNELITTVASFARNAKPNGVPSQEFLKNWIADHATFKASEVTAAFVEDGRSKTAAYPALNVLVEKKILRKLGPGEYQRTDVQALAPPKSKTKSKTKPKKTPTITAGELILRTARRRHGRFSSANIKAAFTAEGLSPTGSGPALKKLVNDKQIKPMGDGEYVLLNQGNGKAPPPAPAPVQAEVVTNG